MRLNHFGVIAHRRDSFRHQQLRLWTMPRRILPVQN
jgi:hypothetical protein